MLDDFTTAISMKDVNFMRKVSKGNLHSHAGKGCSIEYICKKLDIADIVSPRKFSSLYDMHKWYSNNIGKYCNDYIGLLTRWEGCFLEASEDHLEVMVQSFSLEVINAVGGMERFMEILEGFHHKHCPETLFLPEITFSRSANIDSSMKQLEYVLTFHYFKSLDICFDELSEPIEKFVSLYRMCKEAGLILKAHVGEFGTATDVYHAVRLLELNEVHHGIAAAESTEVMDYLKERKIVLNICPSSNYFLNVVHNMGDHPIQRLVRYGVEVTVNTDDQLIFQSSLSKEYLLLYENGVLTPDELNDIRKRSLKEAVIARYKMYEAINNGKYRFFI